MAKLNTASIAGGGVEVKQAILAGGAANALLAIANLRADAQLVGVTVEATGALPVDKTAATTVVAGGVKVNAITTGDVVRVIYTQRAH